MGLRDLVVLLDGTDRDEAKLGIALNLAQRFDAHLTGYCSLELLFPADMSFAMGGYPDLWALPEFAQQIDAQAKAKAAIIEATFREALRRNGVRGDWELDGGAVIPALTQRSHATDLLVIGQTDPDNPPPAVARTLVEDILMTAGRPILLVPYAGTFPTVGSNVLLGWTETREAARAVHDALPLIDKSASVTVLTVETPNPRPDYRSLPGAEIAAHLARHGLTVATSRTIATEGLSAADALLDYASDVSADLLVLGGYGHSRTREMIMGGVTRDILRHMTIPVLMSH